MSRSNNSARRVAVPVATTTSISYGKSLLLTLCIFVLMLIVAGICVGLARGMFSSSVRDGALAGSVVQNVVAFCGAALITSFFLSSRPFAFVGLTSPLKGITIVNVIVCLLLGLPFLNELVWFNSAMHLPVWMQWVENWMRALETEASATVDALLGVNSVGGLIVNILIIGALTGFCEEIFFRGTLQRVLNSHGVNKHIAVWIAAFVFSLLHFQFFGFLPRLILGAFFGYLLIWTSSIWACAFAHALFNSTTVVTVWLSHRGIDASIVEQYGVQTDGFPWMACVSFVLLITYIYLQRRRGF